MKGCGWMTCHLTVHTIIMHMNKKSNKGTDRNRSILEGLPYPVSYEPTGTRMHTTKCRGKPTIGERR